jgi:hypothetical protein
LRVAITRFKNSPNHREIIAYPVLHGRAEAGFFDLNIYEVTERNTKVLSLLQETYYTELSYCQAERQKLCAPIIKMGAGENKEEELQDGLWKSWKIQQAGCKGQENEDKNHKEDWHTLQVQGVREDERNKKGNTLRKNRNRGEDIKIEPRFYDSYK